MKSEALLEVIQEKKLKTKAGISLDEYLCDMNKREAGMIICNFSDSREEFSVTSYITDCYSELVERGIQLFKELSGAKELIRYEGNGTAVLRDPTALYHVLEYGEVRCDLAGQEYISTHISYGFHGKPTLVVTPEDCLMLADISENKPIRKVIACFDENRKKYREVLLGTSLADIVRDIYNTENITAYLIGNQLGELVSPGETEEKQVDFSYHYDTVLPFYKEQCIVNEISKLAQMGMEESCQKCVICREGTWQTAYMMRDAIQAKSKESDLQELEDIFTIVSAGSMCQFGKQILRPIKQAFQLFQEDYSEHLINKNCNRHICGGTKKYKINPQLCNGCAECAELCEYDAIDGKAGFIHMIDEKMCKCCGKCAEGCPKEAIVFGGDFKVPVRLVKAGRFK